MFWSQTKSLHPRLNWWDQMFSSQYHPSIIPPENLMRWNVLITEFPTWQNVCIPGLPDEHSELVSLQWRWCHLPCRAQGEPEIRPCLKGKRQTAKGKVGNILKIKTLWLTFSTSLAGFHRPVLPRTGLHHLDGQPLCYEVNHFTITNCNKKAKNISIWRKIFQIRLDVHFRSGETSTDMETWQRDYLTGTG